MMQALQIGTKFASEVVEDPKLKNNLSMLSKGLGAGAQLGSMAGAFTAPSKGTELGIADSKSYEAFKKNPEGIFGGALPKGGNFDLPKDMMGDGFGLKMPKGWNTPINKGIFDFTPQDTLQDQWNPGLTINW